MNYKQTQLKKYFDIDTTQIKHFKDGRAYLHIGVALAREHNLATDTITGKDTRTLVDKLFSILFSGKNKSIDEAFEEYLAWRLSIGTKSKTMLEDKNEFHRFFKDSLGKMKIHEINPVTIKEVLFKITANNAISRTRFNSAKSVLNGFFTFLIDKGYMDQNPLQRIDFKQFKKRFKPVESRGNYSRDDVIKIVTALRDSSDVYDLAIRFFFHTCLRIGELKAIQYRDIRNGMLTIRNSIAEEKPAYIDKDGNIIFGRTEKRETVVKGAANEGIRDFPLPPEALSIAETLHDAFPDNRYLFMHNGCQLTTVTFNRHLKKICDQLEIDYLSSHRIRFTNCDGLYFDGGINKRSLQAIMGHSSPTMTDHYINSHGTISDDTRKVVNYLNVP
ncbi:MAG: tyrosine-type recombinase/integrase [Lachnospiraceae bacterium]|nr:tyrosine-type recombinase/integrase [Candidatus Darwinimomas equi]